MISILRRFGAATIVSALMVSSAAAQHVEIDDHDSGHSVLRIGQNYTLRQGDSIEEVVVIYGSATIEGHVRNNVVVVLGTVNVTRTAVIDGSLVVPAGTATIQPGAVVRRDLVVAAGNLDAPRDFMAGGQHVVIGTTGIADQLRGVVPWLTEGLLLGRLIVPRLEWVWVVVAVIFLMSLLLCLVFMDGVRACADTIAQRPLGTFLMGLLVLLLTGPVSIVLAASVIGLAVLPFLCCALVIAWMVGKVAVKVRIGDSIVGHQGVGTRADSIRSFVIGFAVVALAYMVPVLGIIVWAIVGVSGLGAATMAFTGAYRREKKAASPRIPVPPPPPPPPVIATPPFVAPAPPPVAAAAPLNPVFSEPPVVPVFETTAPPPAARAVDHGTAAATVAAATAFTIAGLPRAQFAERAAALVLDIVLVLLVNDMFDLSRRGPGGLVLLLAYHIGFWMWRGATLGGMACRLRVVRVDGAPLEFVDALVRALAGLFSLAAAGIGFLWILRDPQGQGWHDKIAGTYVVKVPRM